jgi:hypothetical protein
MSTTLKAPYKMKNSECKKGQLSNWPSIPYVAKMDIVTSKEEPQFLKVRLPDDTCLNMPIFSHGNTEEYLAHIVAVFRIIKQIEAGHKVQEARKGCCEAVQGVEESPRSRWVLGQCLVGC